MLAVLWQFALFGVVAAACAFLFVYAFMRPRGSRKGERAVDKPLARGQRWLGRAPGRAGGWLATPFRSSRKATRKSASAGRKTRKKTGR